MRGAASTKYILHMAQRPKCQVQYAAHVQYMVRYAESIRYLLHRVGGRAYIEGVHLGVGPLCMHARAHGFVEYR